MNKILLLKNLLKHLLKKLFKKLLKEPLKLFLIFKKFIYLFIFIQRPAVYTKTNSQLQQILICK